MAERSDCLRTDQRNEGPGQNLAQEVAAEHHPKVVAVVSLAPSPGLVLAQSLLREALKILAADPEANPSQNLLPGHQKRALLQQRIMKGIKTLCTYHTCGLI